MTRIDLTPSTYGYLMVHRHQVGEMKKLVRQHKFPYIDAFRISVDTQFPGYVVTQETDIQYDIPRYVLRYKECM